MTSRHPVAADGSAQPEDGRAAAAAVDLLRFDVGSAACALPLACVVEVCRAVAVLPLPGAPATVAGAIDVRGRIVPVLDVRARFGLPPREVGPDDHFVIGWAGARQVALVVDRATDVARVAAEQIESAAALSTVAESVVGIARLPSGLVIVHDLGTFLSAAESGQLEAALASSAGARRAS